MIEWLTKASALELVIWSIFIGIMIGVFAVFYTRRILGSLVRRIIENGCTSPETAMTLCELGCSKNFFIKSSLKGGILKNAVCVIKNNDSESQGINPEEDKLYIPEEKRHSSELRFSGKDTDVFGIIIALAVFIALAFALTKIIPYITDLIGDLK